jgi:hypothetical protein
MPWLQGTQLTCTLSVSARTKVFLCCNAVWYEEIPTFWKNISPPIPGLWRDLSSLAIARRKERLAAQVQVWLGLKQLCDNCVQHLPDK